MKKQIYLFAMLAACGISSAQSFELQDKKGATVAAGTIFDEVTYPDSTMEHSLLMKNTGNSTIALKIERMDEVLNKLAGEDTASPYFCTGIICLTPEQTSTTINLTAGDTLGFKHYLKEASVPGFSKVTYKFSVGSVQQLFTFRYNKTLGVGSVKKVLYAMYPNPASEYVNVKTATGSTLRHVCVRDITGSVLVDESASGNSHVINVNSLKAGVYFLSVLTGEGEQHGKLQVIR